MLAARNDTSRGGKIVEQSWKVELSKGNYNHFNYSHGSRWVSYTQFSSSQLPLLMLLLSANRIARKKSSPSGWLMDPFPFLALSLSHSIYLSICLSIHLTSKLADKSQPVSTQHNEMIETWQAELASQANTKLGWDGRTLSEKIEDRPTVEQNRTEQNCAELDWIELKWVKWRSKQNH